MPELVEVEVTRRELLSLLNCQVEEVHLSQQSPSLFKFSGSRPTDLQILTGTLLKDIQRLGKQLLWRFEDSLGRSIFMLNHLGMSGAWRLDDPTQKKHDHLNLKFNNNHIAIYHDPRRFGRLDISMDPNDLIAQERIDCLSADFNLEALQQRLQTPTPIKPHLLDQNAFPGLGNYLASEILWRAKINPTKPANKIKTQNELLKAIKETLEESLNAGGLSIKDYLSPRGTEGLMQLKLKAYGQANKPCPRCGTEIKKTTQNTRATYHCPHCQK